MMDKKTLIHAKVHFFSTLSIATCMFLVCAVSLMITPSKASACTLFAANGTAVDGGGTLIAKTRDWGEAEHQEIRVDKSGYYAICGLYAGEPGDTKLKAGINEKGLVVVSASASSVPKSERAEVPGRPTQKLMLMNCDSVDDALAHKELIRGMKFLMLADSTKAACIESGPDGHYTVHIIENGTYAHTNHYIDDEMKQYNRLKRASSIKRLSRIRYLLSHDGGPLMMEDFIRFTEDRHDGPDCSIWRVGSSEDAPQTLAAIVVRLRPNEVPKLYVKYRSEPNEKGQEKEVHISAPF